MRGSKVENERENLKNRIKFDLREEEFFEQKEDWFLGENRAFTADYVAGFELFFGVRAILIHGSSMQPTYHDGEIVIGVTVKDTSNLERGEVVTFYPAISEQIVYIKRIR